MTSTFAPRGPFSEHLSVEHRLLLASLSTDPDLTTEQELLRQTLDWNMLFQSARAHAIIAQTYTLLSRHPQVVPAMVMERWRQNEKKQKIYVHVLAVETRRLAMYFSEADLEFLMLKGPALAVQLYGTVDSRQYVDLDFLCQPDDVGLLAQILAENGYAFRGSSLPRHLPKNDHHYVFDHSQRGISVELHWKVAHPSQYFPLTFSELRHWAMNIPILGPAVYAPCPEHTLLLQCVHGTKHRWSRLGWVADIAAFITAYPEFDWAKSLEQARSLHCHRMVLIGLALTHEISGSPLPDIVHEAVIKDARTELALQTVKAALFHPDPDLYVLRHVFQLMVRESLIDQWYYLLFKQPFVNRKHQLEYSNFSFSPGLYYLLAINRLMRRFVVRPLLKVRAVLRKTDPDQSAYSS